MPDSTQTAFHAVISPKVKPSGEWPAHGSIVTYFGCFFQMES